MEIYVYKKGGKKVVTEFTAKDLPALLADENNVVWVDFTVKTLDEAETADNILLNIFKFHHLSVEDCREERNQPKVEEFPDHFFFIVHGIKSETNTANFVTKELDGYLGKNFVVTYRNEEFRSIDNVKRNIENNSRIFKRGAAYVLHQILDQLIDLYMPLVDDFDVVINQLEDRVFLKETNNEMLEEIMDLRRSVARLKRISSRQLDVLYRISHGEFDEIPENILPFYRDVHDHLLRISDLAESYRDLVSSLFDIYFSVTANKTNDVMKVLTIFSATMLPLSLIAGIYGMNFQNMPELHSRYGYFFALTLMGTIAGGLLIYFWRKGWFS